MEQESKKSKLRLVHYYRITNLFLKIRPAEKERPGGARDNIRNRMPGPINYEREPNGPGE